MLGDFLCAEAVAPCSAFEFGLWLDEAIVNRKVQEHAIVCHDGWLVGWDLEWEDVEILRCLL